MNSGVMEEADKEKIFAPLRDLEEELYAIDSGVEIPDIVKKYADFIDVKINFWDMDTNSGRDKQHYVEDGGQSLFYRSLVSEYNAKNTSENYQL